MTDSALGLKNRINAFGSKTKKYADSAYLIAVFLYLSGVAGSLTYTTPPYCVLAVSVATVLFILVAAYRLVIVLATNIKRAGIVAGIIIFALVFSLTTNDSFNFVLISLAVVGAIGVGADNILGAGVLGNVILIIYNLVMTFMVDPDSYNKLVQARDFKFFGNESFYVPKFNNRSVTDLAAHYFWIAAAYLWIRGKKLTWAEVAALTVLDVLVYSLSGSSNAFVCFSLLVVIVVVMKLINLVRSNKNSPKTGSAVADGIKKGISVIAKFSYVIIAALFIFFAAIYRLSDPFMNKINSLVHERISFGHRGILEYGIHLIASDVPNYGIDTSADGFYNFIDCSYLNILICSGVLMLLFYLVSMTVVQIRNNKYVYGALLFAVCALSCILEHHLAELPYNFILLLVFADIDPDKKNEMPVVKNKRQPLIINCVAGVIAVLLAIVTVGIDYPRLQAVKRLNSMDVRAGEIYDAIQKNLDVHVSSNSWQAETDSMDSYQYGDVLTKPKDFKSVTGINWDDAVDDLKAHSYYSFSYDGDSGTYSADIAELLLDDAARDLIGKGSVVIEYDVAAGKIYSVWYSNQSGCTANNAARTDRAERFGDMSELEGYYTGGRHE